MDTKLLSVQLAALALCLWGESLVPLFMDRKARLRHGARNIGIGLVNGAVLILFFAGPIAHVAQASGLQRLGLIPRFGASPFWEGWLGFLLFDLWMYGWHRANHRLPIFWRFHRVHHSDAAVDATSAFRFHLGEMILSSILRLAVIPILGISMKQLMWYELILGPVILFHHSNIALPEVWDRLMRGLVVSPNMHRVHHSDNPVETNSNYASIFSFWDRLWGTYRGLDLPHLRYGLKEFRNPRWQTFQGAMTLPAA